MAPRRGPPHAAQYVSWWFTGWAVLSLHASHCTRPPRLGELRTPKLSPAAPEVAS
jgi:hypothetical protein